MPRTAVVARGIRWRIPLEILSLLVLIGLWASFRVVPAYSAVFPDEGEVVLLGNDPWFHLHQTNGAIVNFPRLIRWDVGTNYPKGNRVAAAGLFNLGAATTSLFLGGVESAGVLAPLVLAWSPIILGALSIVFLHLLAREIGGASTATVTILLRIVFPGEELERTLLGFGDYHAAEILLATAGLWTLTRWFNRLAPPSSSVHLWKTAIFASVPLALFQFVWFGAPLHVATTLAAFWIMVASEITRSCGSRLRIASCLPVFLSLLLLTGLTGWVVPDWIMVPSGYRQTILALVFHCLLILIAGIILPSLARAIGRKGAIVASGLAITALMITASLLVDHKRLFHQIHHLLVERNPLISEHLPVGPGMLFHLYGLLLPFAACGFLIAFARNTRFGTSFALCFLAGWTALWIRTSDFGYLTGALVSLPAALGLIEASRFLARIPFRSAALLRSLPWIATTTNVALLIPSGHVKLPFLFRDEVQGMVLATPPWRIAMTWVREHTPRPPLSPTQLAAPWPQQEGFAYPDESYGILAHWSLGNLIPTLGQRIAVLASTQSPFYIEWFLERTEEGALRQLGTRGDVRYLILDATSVCDSYLAEALQTGLSVNDLQVEEGRIAAAEGSLPLLSYGNRFRNAIGARLYLGDGSGLRHHRLVHESREESFVRYRLLPELEAVILKSTPVATAEERNQFLPLTGEGASWTEDDGAYFCYSGQLLPTVKIYERVAGAKLLGKSVNGESATLELELRNSLTGRTFLHRATTEPETDGTLRFTLPYPTTRENGATVWATGPCRILAGGVPSEVEVNESAVREGATIRFGETR